MHQTLMICRHSLFLLLSLLVCTLAQPALAQPAATEAPAATLQLASIFSDHMVLQRDREIPIWGTAAPGTAVNVQLAGKKYETTADASGKWRVDVGPLSELGALEMNVWSDGASLNLADILVGDVWICSGQSNMQWTVNNSNDPEQEIADAANWPRIRLVTVPRIYKASPSDTFESAGWKACSAEEIKEFSAVAYSFGRHLNKELDVPIGLISTNYGGTPMESWTSIEGLASRPTFADNVKVAKAAIESGDKLPHGHPTGLYNAMISPLIPFGIRGAIWYQGESNAGRHMHYRELSEVMITDWRTRWGQGDFPFLLVQLAAWREDAKDWPYLRESQLQTVQTVPNVGMAVATDIGHPTDIHPRNKQDVGKRLGLAARALAYGEDLVYSGPIYKDMTAGQGKITLSFDHIGGGLVAKDGELQGFTIAGENREFVPAKAVIEGDHVVVSSEQVAEPVAVRFNWEGWTVGNLFNAEGLPASPFRTDRF